MRILVTDQNFGDDAEVERRLADAAGADLVVADCKAESDVREALEEHAPDAVLVQFAPVGASAFAAAGGLRAVVRYGIGVDNVDTAAAARAGVAVGRVPDYCVDEVADHTLALLLAVERGIVALAADVSRGGWDFRAAGPVRRLNGRTLALVGFGRIARAVARRARPLGMRIVAHDVHVGADEIRASGVEPLELTDLLRAADVLSVHVPLTAETAGIVDARALSLLPAGALVLNTSRGGLVDEEALASALLEGRIRGAGLDVLASEPPPPTHPLREMAGVILTPHAAWHSDAAVVELREKAMATALSLVRGEAAAGLVA